MTLKDRSIFKLYHDTPEIHLWYKLRPNATNMCWVITLFLHTHDTAAYKMTTYTWYSSIQNDQSSYTWYSSIQNDNIHVIQQHTKWQHTHDTAAYKMTTYTWYSSKMTTNATNDNIHDTAAYKMTTYTWYSSIQNITLIQQHTKWLHTHDTAAYKMTTYTWYSSIQNDNIHMIQQHTKWQVQTTGTFKLDRSLERGHVHLKPSTPWHHITGK